MKAFEKWYGELPMREDAEDFTLATQAKYKKGWRAALEWVLDEFSLSPIGNRGIREELEGGD